MKTFLCSNALWHERFAHQNRKLVRDFLRILQTCIDKLNEWPYRYTIRLNAAKSYHVTYSSKRNVLYQSYYYLLDTRINKVATVRDIGITFDEKTKCKEHIRSVSVRALKLYGAAYRFSRDIFSPSIVLKIVSTYILPVLKYGSCIRAAFDMSDSLSVV